jgi:hypothetical protein
VRRRSFGPRDRDKPGAIGGRLRCAGRGDLGIESEARTMEDWANYQAWRDRRKELLREMQELRLGQEARRAQGHSERRKEWAVEVRWGLPEDEAKVAELLELNGMPRWVASEGPFAVAESGGAVVAAVRCRTEPKRLLLGLLVVDPWSEERALALYAGARTLAREIGANDVVARTDPQRAAYPREAGYHRWGAVWKTDPSQPADRREEAPGGGRPRSTGRLGVLLDGLLFWGWGGRGRSVRRET